MVFLPFIFFVITTCILSFSSISTLAQSQGNDLLWGPYRSNLYFGLRARVPNSISFGLMWTRVENEQIDDKKLRHACEDDNEILGYGWDYYDVRRGGMNKVVDLGNQMNLSMEFLKYDANGIKGSWTARITANSWNRPVHARTIFYVASESSSNMICNSSKDLNENRGLLTLSGSESELGSFKIVMEPHAKFQHEAIVSSLKVPEETLWMAKGIFQVHSFDSHQVLAILYRENQSLTFTEHYIKHIANQHWDEEKACPENGNIYFFQSSFTGAFQFDVHFVSDSVTAVNSVNLDRFPTISKDVKQMFADQFELVFMPKGPFREEDYTKFSHQLLSNLLGGIGYFYGDSKVDKSNNSAYLETGLDFWKSAANARSNTSPNFTEPLELFTGVPSRSFFPRGFLWDEGFHLMVVVDWDLDLAIEILQSWFNLMDDDGWIAREQILGPEARSKVPLQFQTQFPQFANPPTLFLIVETLVNILTGRERYLGTPSKWIANPKAANDLVVDLYTKLQKHYTWFRHTQSGNLTYSSLHRETSNVEGYRWRGRDMQHTLTSGLDDYPRALPPHPGELHVDAISWVGLMADVLGKVAAYLSRPSDVITYARDLIIIKRNAEIIHWSQEAKAFCDTTIKNKDISHVCHKGYMSLFPFLAGLLEPSNLQLEDILNLMGDEKELWSSYGLRSLSLKDPFYGKDENYWRGPIWININYLAIKALLVIAQNPGAYQQKARMMYTELRRNVVMTVYESWKSTGFAWEQYNPETGAGQRTRHFTGWTALIVKIMAMPDLSTESRSTQQDDRFILPPQAHQSSWSLQVLFVIACFGVVSIFRKKITGRFWTQFHSMYIRIHP